MKKNFLINFIKFALAIGLITWLISSGKLDLEIISKLVSKPQLILLVMFLMLINHLLVALRWKLILDQKSSSKLNLISIFKANWIGIFFNSVLPGSVSGDFIKIIYVKDLDEKFTSKYLLGSVLLDRVLGLFGLISIGGVVCLFSYNKLLSLSPEVKGLVDTNIALFALVILCLISVFIFQKVPHLLANPFRKIRFLGSVVLKLEDAWLNLCRIRKHLIKVWIISIFVQAFAAFIFWYLVTQFISVDFTFNQAMTILPIGFIIMSLPIAPAGLGVGHAAFQTLFGYYGINEGANLFNIYFLLILVTNLTGVIPYLLNRRVIKPLNSQK